MSSLREAVSPHIDLLEEVASDIYKISGGDAEYERNVMDAVDYLKGLPWDAMEFTGLIVLVVSIRHEENGWPHIVIDERGADMEMPTGVRNEYECDEVDDNEWTVVQPLVRRVERAGGRLADTYPSPQALMREVARFLVNEDNVARVDVQE